MGSIYVIYSPNKRVRLDTQQMTDWGCTTASFETPSEMTREEVEVMVRNLTSAVLADIPVIEEAEEIEPIQLWPKKGSHMRFLNMHGEECEREEARRLFKPSEVYEVEDYEVDSWKSYIHFVGIHGRFNSVMFEFAD